MSEVPPDAREDGAPADRVRTLSPGDLAFVRLLVLLGSAILLLGGLLVALPTLSGGPLRAHLIAYAIAGLFGPFGLSLLAAAWRIRRRALHGASPPASRRRGQRLFGMALVGAGLVFVLLGLLAEGTLTRALDLLWGGSLAVYGLRILVRAHAADGA